MLISLKSLLIYVLAVVGLCAGKCQHGVVKNLTPDIVKDTTINFGCFEMTIPTNWTFIPVYSKVKPGVVTLPGRIQFAENRFFHFDYGNNIRDYTEPDPMVLPKSTLNYYLHEGVDTAYIIFTDDPSTVDTLKNRRYVKDIVKIDGINATIFYPVKTGYGLCGIYINNFDGKQAPGSTHQFLCSGRDLDSVTQERFLAALKTIRFKPCVYR
jgi:hypothetical protein